jgi:hypothetical protein
MLNTTTPAGAADHSFADVAERLMAEFAARVDLGTISRVILGCRRDLQGSPAGALPELVERLARERLLGGERG